MSMLCATCGGFYRMDCPHRNNNPGCQPMPGQTDINRLIVEIHAVVVKPSTPPDLGVAALVRAARRVVWARYLNRPDGTGWDLLKNAIGDLEDLVGRPEEGEG